MAKNKIAALISSHIDGNEEQILWIALQAAAARPARGTRKMRSSLTPCAKGQGQEEPVIRSGSDPYGSCAS